MRANLVVDIFFLLSVTIIWFMVGYQIILFLFGHLYYRRTREGPKDLPRWPTRTARAYRS
jgi:uncharacterized membrane protein